MDIIFILTSDSYFVARYDDGVGKVTDYQRVILENVDKIEFGVIEQMFNLSFVGKGSAGKNQHSMRIAYRLPSEGKSLKSCV